MNLRSATLSAMHAALPLLSPLLWIRFGLGCVVVLGLPGYLLAGRWLREQDLLSRCMVSLCAGLALPFLYSAFLGRFGLPFRPAFYLGTVLILALLSWLWPAWRNAIAGWTEGVRVLTRLEISLAMAAMLLSLALLVTGFHRLPAPPHIHDASNHAWLTLRIVQCSSLDLSLINADLAGAVKVGYLPGIHAAAALIARVSGVAPYISVWMLALVLCAMIPGAFSLLWRSWRVPPSTLGLALLLCVANPLGPGGILGWGGFGQIAGFFLVPLGVLALRSAWRNPSWSASLAAGFFLGALIFVHASELIVVLGATLLALERRIHPSWRGSVVLIAALVFVCGPEVWQVYRGYPSLVASELPHRKEFLDSLTRLWRSGGRGPVLQLLLPVGWILGFRSSWARRLVLASLVLGIFYLFLQSYADPLTRMLATPFYRQAPRILYLQFYLLPPLLALPLTRMLEMAPPSSAAEKARSSRRVLAHALLAVLLASALWSGFSRELRNYRSSDATVPFTRDDYRQACTLATLVPPNSIVANFWDDGSVWAMHVSGRRFLQPCSWPLFDAKGRSLHEVTRGLVETPWPEETARLLGRLRIHYLYLSDGVFGQGSGLH
ncbi:MAG TPA: DUF6541 family protein, partial [Candidatus Krumholzibacteria bacterium]|nr:DUF6541 family protein [Candidatus Krumholzibacteria bacterium]